VMRTPLTGRATGRLRGFQPANFRAQPFSKAAATYRWLTRHSRTVMVTGTRS
jgi:hypothetical protein